MAQVRLEKVVKAYGPYRAVDDLSLTVNDGEFVALVGPSGCGKTTTLNLIAGLTETTGGDIFIGDRLVNDVDPKDRVTYRDGLSELRAVSYQDGVPEPRLPAEDAETFARGNREEGA